ncbi:MAG: hypothetical protein AVDCRST_MAG77-5299, partial [uncultured Chloroflexi bacterium]
CCRPPLVRSAARRSASSSSGPTSTALRPWARTAPARSARPPSTASPRPAACSSMPTVLLTSRSGLSRASWD